jgi:uncharacterized protein (DUF1778 family)
LSARKEERNTRDVVPFRLSGREREQIASAATRQKLSLSAFVREAALQASAIVEGKVSVKASEHEAPTEREHDRPLVPLDTEREPHIVDGEIVSW